MKKNEEWIAAKKKYKLSDAHIQMARELGMNPRKFGSLANNKQEQWKLPLPDFIEELYFKRSERKGLMAIPDFQCIIQTIYPRRRKDYAYNFNVLWHHHPHVSYRQSAS